MSTIGSGERVVILGDRISTSSPAGTDILTPLVGRVVIFLHTNGGTPTGVYSKDSDGVVTSLGGGGGSDSGWRLLTTGNPTLTGDIAHEGGVAVGVTPALGESMPAGTVFRVDGGTAQNGPVFFQEIAAALADLAGRTQVFRKTSDGGLYSKPEALTERRIDAPGLSRKSLDPGETVTVPNGFQYIAYNTLSLTAGVNVVLEGDADLVIL